MELANVAGSGPDGRVQARDVEAARTAAEPTPVKATPLARRIAASEGIDLRAVAGTGPEGTITREDVEAAFRGQGTGVRQQESGVREQPPAIADHASRITDHREASLWDVAPITETIIPLSSLRRTIAERMSASAFTAPHVTLFTEADGRTWSPRATRLTRNWRSLHPTGSRPSSPTTRSWPRWWRGRSRNFRA